MRFVIKLLGHWNFLNSSTALIDSGEIGAKLSYTAMCNFVMPDFFQAQIIPILKLFFWEG